MKFHFVASHGQAPSHAHIQGDVLLLPVVAPLNTHKPYRVLDGTCEGGLSQQAEHEEFEGKSGTLLVRPMSKFGTQYAVVFGAGSTLADKRAALAGAFQKAKALRAKTVVLGPVVQEGEPLDELVKIGELIGELSVVAGHNRKTYKTAHSGFKAPPQFEIVKVVAPRHHAMLLQEGIQTGERIGAAINFARDLADEPANIVTPSAFRDIALKVATETVTKGTIEANVLDAAALKEQNANGILIVAQGSAEAPYLIELTYHPEGGATEQSLAMIGKTVTFDTGGNDIKTGGGMRDMKRDKTGGCNVLAAFKAAAELNVPMTVRAYFPATENMVGAASYRAGDVFTSMSGRTVEIGNTDAEGRLTLIEALELAQRHGATRIVDVATLTGAAKQVGGDAVPLAFGSHAEFSALVAKAASDAGEKIALQEMLPEVRKYNESEIADVCNLPAPKGAGAMAAAWFIFEWLHKGKSEDNTRDVELVHLDIANVAAKSDRATGYIVRTLITLMRTMPANR